MKKVWILEGFISKESMIESLNQILEMKESADTEDGIKACNEVETVYRNQIARYPEGHWLGYQGKVIYSQFCECAKETLRNMRNQNMRWRVVEATIEDHAKYWTGYKVVKENSGVLKYLLATL